MSQPRRKSDRDGLAMLDQAIKRLEYLLETFDERHYGRTTETGTARAD